MRIRSILAKASEEGREALHYTESKEILETWGIPVSRGYVAKNSEEASRAARSVGYPVVMKVLSPDLVHKTEAGAVSPNLRNKRDVIAAYESIEKSVRKSVPDARVLGVVVEEMCKGIEIIVGVAKDPQFGHTLLFGMGGTFVELLKDVSFRLIPVEPVDIREMMEEVKGFALVKGYRGLKGDSENLTDLLVKVSGLVVKYPEIVEMDMNPVFNSPAGSVVADVRIRIERK
jgi:acetyl-CoA synthetase (ADP-forming)